MKNQFLILAALLLASCAAGIYSTENFLRETLAFQNELNAEYRNPKETPLRGENFTKFKEHPFFKPDQKYRVNAKFTATPDAEPFDIPTSSGKTKPYVQYGKADFEIDGKVYSLAIYQSLDLRKVEGYQDYLFLPFRDATNGTDTYGGGRYLDLRIPKNGNIIIDFNKAYHPLCAYNAYDYSCPVVPEVNILPLRIEAGVKYEDIWFEH